MTTDLSRRDLTLLFSSLSVSLAAAQQKQLPSLSTKVYANDEIPYKGDQTKKGREFLNGLTHSGFNIEVHETVLGPSTETHAPHRHEHEEIIIVVEGTLETNVEGRREKADQGSVIYFGSNQLHNARNVGTTPCRYYVLELRGSTGSTLRQQV
jgi:XRE family transcriptional regulator, regulator of sulfur utilization